MRVLVLALAVEFDTDTIYAIERYASHNSRICRTKENRTWYSLI